MKKIYASMFVLALGASITAGARTYQRAETNFDGFAKVKSIDRIEKLATTDKTLGKKAANVKANAGEEWNNLGQGIFIDQIFRQGQINVTVEESTTTPGFYRVPDAFTQVSETAGAFLVDATNPNFVYVPDQETGIEMTVSFQDGTSATGPLTILSYSQYAAINEITPEEFAEAFPEYVITMENGVINMPAGSILGNIGDALWLLNRSEMALVLPGADYVPEWGEIKTGQMLDTFVETMFNGYVAEEVDVPIQKNNWKEGMYRIIDPWFKLFGDPVADLEAGYYFVFDASNPACVSVPFQSASINAGNRGLTYIESLSEEYESAEAFLASEDAGYNITMDVETRTINMSTSEILSYTDGTTTTASPIFFYWPDYDQQHIYPCGNNNTPGYIKLPDFTGISSVAVDNSNAKAEYYNIQGVRVNNPVAGQLYIVKKGNEVSKQIVR